MNRTPSSGRMFKDDGSIINIANVLDTTITSIVTGAKTVTNVAAAAFAGASKLVGRKGLVIQNKSDVDIDYGTSYVTSGTGGTIVSGDIATFTFTPDKDGNTLDIYVIAAANKGVRMVEWK